MYVRQKPLTVLLSQEEHDPPYIVLYQSDLPYTVDLPFNQLKTVNVVFDTNGDYVFKAHVLNSSGESLANLANYVTDSSYAQVYTASYQIDKSGTTYTFYSDGVNKGNATLNDASKAKIEIYKMGERKFNLTLSIASGLSVTVYNSNGTALKSNITTSGTYSFDAKHGDVFLVGVSGNWSAKLNYDGCSWTQDDDSKLRITVNETPASMALTLTVQDVSYDDYITSSGKTYSGLSSGVTYTKKVVFANAGTYSIEYTFPGAGSLGYEITVNANTIYTISFMASYTYSSGKISAIKLYFGGQLLTE